MLIGVIAEELLSGLAVTDRTAHATDDRFLQARIFQVGFIAPGLVDETNLGAERTFNTYVTQDYQGIWPDLVDDTVPEIFYSFTRSFGPVLVSAFFKETDLIHAPSLDVVAIHPSAVYIDPDTIYVPAFSAGLAPNLVIDSDVIRGTIIRRDGDALVLLLETFDDTDVIYAPLSANGLSPGIVTEYYPDNDNIYAASQVIPLGAGIFSPGDTFFAPFIFSQLNPSRILDTDVLIGPELRTPGRMGLLESDDAFHVPSVQFGALAPPLVVEADIIPSILSGSVPPIVPFDSRVDFDDTFYGPNVIVFQTLTPHFWPDVDNILPVASVFSDADKHLLPGLFVATDVIFAPDVPAPPVLATWNPADKAPDVVLSGGNLVVTDAVAFSSAGVRATKSLSSSKAYFEVTVVFPFVLDSFIGVTTAAADLTSSAGNNHAWCNISGGAIFVNSATSSGGLGGSFSSGDVMCVSLDMPNKRIWFRKNGGNWNNDAAANPTTNTNGFDVSSLFTSAPAYPIVLLTYTNQTETANFGASAFARPVPSGFVAWSIA